jgi:alpha-tubulin suppressor-like RCC1 family protein
MMNGQSFLRGSAAVRKARAAALVAWAIAVGACEAPPSVGDDGGRRVACTTDTDCDDGLFCSGVEACAPDQPGADARGCVRAPSCLDTQRCIESERRCVTQCAVAPDADGDGFDAVACGGADCDDADPNRFPGNPEVCDDADRDEDCDPSTFGSRDADGDGFVDAACCNVDGDQRRCGTDCNDRRRSVHPGATEACEGLDNDCDGAVDEGLLVMQWPDLDHDLHGDETSEGELRCPGSPGWATVRDDCDDSSPLRHRAQLEICDRVDNDCDGIVDESPVAVPWYLDADGDGFGAPSADPDAVRISCEPIEGYSTRPSDCDDRNRLVSPAGREICNGIDDDCNGWADAPGLPGGDLEDDDGDGFPDRSCGGNDCDDANPFVHPRAPELCNGIDDDCDGVIDGASAMARWYLDRDGDGFGDESEPFIESCAPQPARVPRGGDCDDGNASVRPGVPDLCDDRDEDCDGRIDENGIRFAFFPDADGDGWGTTDRDSIVFRCTRPAGTSERTGDCADLDPLRHPTAAERCNMLDDDCDGAIDEATTELWYVDADGDGYGAGAPIATCLPSGTASPRGDDCDDGDPTRHPGRAELCNGRDDDCDGTVDELADASCDRPNATGTCGTGGVCSLSCATGFGDCDGGAANGCEADLRTSATDCGACDASCGLADTCGRPPGTPGVCDVSPVVELTGEWEHVIGRRASGGTFGWGRGLDGQHLLGSNVTALEPQRGQLDDVAQLAAGRQFGCALQTSGAVQCWGRNTSGELAVSGVSVRLSPARVPLPGTATSVCAGYAHACAVLSDGSVWCWGQQGDGRLGNGLATVASVPTPQQARSAEGPLTDAVGVQCGRDATCVLRESAPGVRRVSCFGLNTSGQLGQGALTPTSSGLALDVLGLPTDLVAMGRGAAPASCVRTSTGRAYCWGDNQSSTGSGFSLGLGGSGGSVPSPVTPPGLDAGVVDIAIHDEGGCAIVRSGAARELRCWGYGPTTNHWLGNGAVGHVGTPTLVGPLDDPWVDVTAMTTGYQFVCAVRAGGDLWCIGQDGFGQLGNGAPAASSGVPVRVLRLP